MAHLLLNIPGFEGTSKLAKYAKWHELTSYTWSFAKNVRGEFLASTQIETIAPKLMVEIAQGHHLPTVEFVIYDESASHEMYHAKFSSAVFGLFNQSLADGSGVVPFFNLSFTFSQVNISEYHQRTSGAWESVVQVI